MAADRNRIDRASTHHDRGEAVYRAALAIANELSLDAVLQKIVDAARELVNTRYAALGVVDEERRKLTKFVVSGVTGREIGAIEHWPYGLGLLGELIHFPHPLRIKDISKDPRSIGFPPNHPPMTSFLGVPLIRGERVLGNFYMTDKIGAEEFTEDDEELLSLFAVHAAIAIENARLYTETDIRLKEKVVEVERAESRARFLSDLGALLLRVPPGGELPLESIAEQATEPLADAVGMILVDPLDADRIVSEVIFHRIPERAEAATGLLHGAMDAVKDAVIRGGRPVLLTNASRPAGAPLFDQAAMESARFSAVVAVPVATRQTAYGALFSLASRPLSLTEDDLKFALLIADRLGSALDSSALYRQQLEAKARAQELADLAQAHATELETILDTMSEAVYVTDAGLRVVRMNRAFAGLVGLGDSESRNESFRALMDRLQPQTESDDPAEKELPMIRALGGASFTNHVIRITPIGSGRDRFLSISGAPIRDSSGRITAAVNVARDVTELHEIDRLKDEFISVASHEMRTPLTVIKGYIQMLTKRLENRETKGSELDMARQILNQTDRLATLTNRLLDVSRVQFGRLTLESDRVDLTALVRDLVERMRVTMEYHKISLKAEEPVFVEADAGRLEQVLTNLVNNAAKYSPDGAEIDVSLERKDGSALITVRDHGYGIPKERQGRIFQRFYRATTDERKSGLGLGLYVSKGIVEAHRGEIWFQSEDGKGSTFFVRLPAA